MLVRYYASVHFHRYPKQVCQDSDYQCLIRMGDCITAIALPLFLALKSVQYELMNNF